MALDNDLNTRSVSWDDEISNYEEAQDEVGSMTRPRIKGAANRSIETPIHTHPTFDSSDVEDGSGGSRDLSHKKKVMMDSTYREIFEQTEKARVRANSEDTGDTNATMFTHFERNVNHALYIGLFATFGTVIRIYLGRFFGLDCEQGTDGVDDFLASFSSNICVTASGKTQQTGGALFSDLPANMLGCFMIGVLSPAVAVGHPIPWFRKEHPLQNHDGFLTALKIGFCGCLTTCKYCSLTESLLVVCCLCRWQLDRCRRRRRLA
jgi:fluoride ion exporter CrcB/FEX